MPAQRRFIKDWTEDVGGQPDPPVDGSTHPQASSADRVVICTNGLLASRPGTSMT
jgi:hypothetical protein